MFVEIDSYELHQTLCEMIVEKYGLNAKLINKLNYKNSLNENVKFTGISTESLHEIHVFLGPLWINCNPDEETVKKYTEVVEMYNNLYEKQNFRNFKKMKAPVLTLNFKDIGEITLLQSSLYYSSDSVESVIRKSHQIVELFQTAGFEVLREKIEASADGIKGIPYSNEEAKLLNNYFEFHIRCGRKENFNMNSETMGSETINSGPMTQEENELLQLTSANLSSTFGIPVPLSYNRAKKNGFQRYLNMRFRLIGLTEIDENLKKVKEYIYKTTPFYVQKIIREYVWYDTNVNMDKGWIDF